MHISKSHTSINDPLALKEPLVQLVTSHANSSTGGSGEGGGEGPPGWHLGMWLLGRACWVRRSLGLWDCTVPNRTWFSLPIQIVEVHLKDSFVLGGAPALGCKQLSFSYKEPFSSSLPKKHWNM